MEDDEEAAEPELGSSSQWDEDVEVPREGMSFGTEEEVYNYYKKYAARVGFGVRRSNTKVGGDRKLKYFSIACSRSRKPTSTTKNRKNSSIRTDCKAKINLIVDSDRRLVVSKVRLDHNHPLGLGRTQHAMERRVEQNEQAGTSSTNNGHPHDGRDGGSENSQFGERKLRYYIKNNMYLRLRVGDAEALQDYFLCMQKKDAKFFYIVDLNEEGRLRNAFWVDSRSRAAYETFGDVILLDTTYLIDKYDMPLTLFVGVNHHGQSILFGCALLSSEDTETYVWLLRSWLACMPGSPPKAFVTDQGKSIQDAVSEVLPDACHRLCLWHIMKKVPERLGGFAEYQVIKKRFKCVVYESLKPDEFEENWRKMITEYNLLNNEWFQSLYLERHRWVPIFVKDTFWAGLSIAQRGESMNAFFDGYVNSRTSLKQFLEQYDSALRSKVENENKADSTSFNTSIPLVSDLHIEKQFREVYTHDIFKLFQEELKGLLYCNTSFLKADESISKYEVTDSVKVKDDRSRREVAFDVLYNEIESEVQCTCHLFEFRGLLCRHAVAVLMKKNVNEVPSCYILSRWRKDIKRKYTLMKSSYADFGTNPQVQRYDRLCNKFFQIAEIGAKSHAKSKLLMEYLGEVKEKLKSDSTCGRNQPIQEQSAPVRECDDAVTNGIPNPGNWFFSPLHVQRIGAPLTKRKEMTEEHIKSKKKKMANPVNSLADISAGVPGNQPFLRYHYIQMYPDQNAKFVNPYAYWPNFSSSIPLQQPGRVGPNGSTDGGFVGGSSAINHNNKNSGTTQTTGVEVVQLDSSVGTEKNPVDESSKL